MPDPDDHHVLAAAIVPSSNVIVTFNLKDFAGNQLAQYNIEAQHPDLFLLQLADLDPVRFLTAVKNTRLRLKNPPKSVDESLATINNTRLYRCYLCFYQLLRTHTHRTYSGC